MPIDYDAWARTYDRTRRASPGVVRAILEALGEPRSRRLLDVGTGTGNFAVPLAEAGFRLALCDLSLQMLQSAARKLGPSVSLAAANAEKLPYREDAFDCAVCVNVVRHLRDRKAAFAEARRVLRAGPLVVRTTTRETERSHWAHYYFPTLVRHQPSDPSEDELLDDLRAAGFSEVELRRFRYQDEGDGSFQALKYTPDAFLDPGVIGNLAVFQRMPADEVEAGLAALRRDHRAGRLHEIVAEHAPLVAEYGDGVVVAAR